MDDEDAESSRDTQEYPGCWIIQDAFTATQTQEIDFFNRLPRFCYSAAHVSPKQGTSTLDEVCHSTRGGGGREQGQGHRKGGALTRLAFHPDSSPMGFNNPLTDI
jgi:hypothetical protein